MAPSRRNSSGTPTPASQRTISSFFSSQLKQTPSPSQDNSKPCLHIGPPSPPPEGSSFVGRKLKVYWPLDKAWYNGVVHSWCNESGKHKILYEDGEEESVVLASEKIEWIDDQSDCIVGKKSFRRLRKSGDSTALDDSGVLDTSGVLESSTIGKKKIAHDAKELELSEDHENGGNESESDGDWGPGAHDALQNMEEDELEMEVDAKKKKRKQLTEKVPIKRQKVLKTKTEIQGAVDVMKNMTEAHAVAVSPGIKEQDKLQRRGSSGNGGEGEIQIVLSGEIAERFGSRSAEKFKFLYKSRRDSAGRGPSDPNFDSRTLFLPSEFLKGLTGGQRQWWEFKSKHMDKVLFFKMGKFYELFEMDAHIGAKELDLQYMKGEQPHCGFPEKNYAENAERLTRKGYRVLVVEQTETPDQLEQRKRETGAKDKVVKREICAVLTKGTILDGDMVANNSDPAYFLSITETCGRTPDENCVLGVCASDTSRGLFLLDEFPDDSSRTRLRSILSELLPVEIVKPKENLSEMTERVLRDYTRMPLINTLIPSLEFWDAERSASEIVKFYSFHPCTISGQHSEGIPYLLHRLMNCSIGKVALSAFGGCMFYLRQAMLDVSLLPSGRFEIFPGSNMSHDLAKNCPEDERSFVKDGSNVFELNMAIDSSALENLEILENNTNGGTSGTLFGLLDHCVTPFGRRLLRQWLVRPLLDVDSILERQRCLSDLKEVAAGAVTSFRRQLIGIPDMERLLARLCASCGGSGRYSQRVVLYEDAAKQLLKEFTKALRGFQAVIAAVSSFETCVDLLASGYLLSLVSTGKTFPVISSIISHFEAAFDWIEAEKTGRILPRPGVDTNFDAAVQEVSAIEARFEEHLNKQRQKFGNSPEIIYTTVGKESYLLEVPDHLLSKVPSDYELRSSRKGYRRFWTPQIKELLQELSLKQEEKEVVLKGILQELLKQFCQSHNELLNAVKTIAELDALMSLSIASTYMEGNVCQPSFSRETSFLKAKALRHPTIQANVNCGGSFVPNNVSLGGDSAPFMLLTGPNMGGKSTFLRQVCLAVILAQIGADVPAESFELSPVDKLFVRMGAKDHIMAAQSTFFVELSETANMLRRATENSLVALDELGRGTSTSDGQAIAHAVLQYLAHNVGCRGLFSSHYHRLADDHSNDPCVSLNHMMCKVEEGADGLEEVTFLYKLQAGQCPKSYGVNVARIAGMPSIVLHRANEISAQFEKDHSVCLPSAAQSLVEELLQTRSTESQMRELILLWEKTGHLCMKSINVPSGEA